MTVFPNNNVSYKYNKEKDLAFSPYGDSVGIEDVIVDNKITLQEGDKIFVKDSCDSDWVEATFLYAHDGEVYAKTYSIDCSSWRYAMIKVEN